MFEMKFFTEEEAVARNSAIPDGGVAIIRWRTAHATTQAYTEGLETSTTKTPTR